MVTGHELFCVVLVPIFIAGLLTLGARVNGRRWLYPVAAGAAFLTAYRQLGAPQFPPRDGIDWLFWVTIPVTLLGVLDDYLKPKVSWIAGVAAGLSVGLVGWPLCPSVISAMTLSLMIAAFAVASIALVTLLKRAGDQIGSLPILLGLSGVAGGAAVLVMSCNTRILGIYGIAVASAIGPVALLGGYKPGAAEKGPRVSSTATVGLALIVAVLVGGHLYADPGITWTQSSLVLASLALLGAVALLPIGKPRGRAVVALLATAALIGAFVVPTALAALKAATENPYPAQDNAERPSIAP